jgi:hypothetical protein
MTLKVKTAKNSKLPKLLENYFDPVGKGGWPPISIWINLPSLGRNGLHCVEVPHQMRKFLLNLAPGEPLALVQELPYFDNSIKLDPLLSSALYRLVHNMIIGFLLYAVGVERSFLWVLVRCSFSKCNQTFFLPETYVAANVDHGIVCTCD